MDENDSRFSLFSSYFLKRFSLKIETWNKMMMNNEYKVLLVDFITNGDENLLVFVINTANQLQVSKSFPQDSYLKAVYFVRNKSIEIQEENFHETISINELSPNLLDELDVLLADVFIPLVQSQCNQKILPAVISTDIERHICDFYSSLVQFQGVLLNQIVLPILDCDSKVSEAIEKFEDSDDVDIELKTNIEDSINNWITDIRIILNENVSKIFEKIKYPVPSDELMFWDKRSKNLCSILNQLKNPRVKKMIKYLVMTKSAYVTVYMDILKEIIKSIVECNLICKLFKPLEHQITKLENTEFLDLEEFLQPTMNIVCCMWSYSKYYKEQNIILLLQEMSNFLIEKATVLLNPNSIFDRDPLDVITNVQKCYQVLQKFRLIFSKCRDNLEAFYLNENESDIRYWNFKETEVFERLNQFMYRLKKLKDFLKASIEFGKLEEIVFGCLSGHRLTAQIYNLFEDYQKISNYFSTLQCNPFDTEDDSFFTEIHKFNESSKIADEKLTTIFKKAFDDCNNLENCYKLLTMIGPLLERKNIRVPFSEKYENLRVMVNNELDIIKKIFDNSLENCLKSNRFLPTISSEISWLMQLNQRIDNAVEPFFSIRCFEIKNSDQIEFTTKKYQQMRDLLTHRKEEILEKWNNETPNICEKFLSEPLLIKNKNNRLELNFSQEFEILLKNIKFLKNSLKTTNFPSQIESLYDRIEELFNNRLLLHHLVRWHNFIVSELHNMELQLIESEMTNFYDLLSKTLLSMKWNDNASDEIKESCRIIENIYLRILECKNNLNSVLHDIGLWKSIPLYERKRDDARRDALINIQDSKENCVQRYNKIKNSHQKVIEMLEKNYKLFFNIREEILILKIDNIEKKSPKKGGKKGLTTPKGVKSTKQTKPSSGNKKVVDKKNTDKSKISKVKPKLKMRMPTKKPILKSAKGSRKNKFVDEKTTAIAEENERRRKVQMQKWDNYKEYVDALIVRELQEAVQISFRSLLNEMTLEEKRLPLFEIKIELQEPKLVFVPDLEMESTSGFCSIIESILEDIVGMANQMTRIDEKNTLNYGTEVTEFYVNSDMYDQILAIVAQAVNLCWDFLNQNFHSYNFLWLTDKKQHLELFLKYGKAFKKEDFDALKMGKIKESPPKIGKFKEQFDFYDSLMNEIRNIKCEHVIDGWLKIDLRFVKASLENYVSKWSYLFKQHLIDFVSKTLNDFITFNSKSIEVFTSTVTEENFSQLLEVMEYLNKVRDFDLKIESVVASLKETIELLQFYKYEFPDEIYEQLDRMPDEWLKTKKIALTAKQNVAPLQAQHIIEIQEELNDFDDEHQKLQKNLKHISIFKNKETNEIDFEIFNNVIESLNTLKAKIEKNSEMSKLFDIEIAEHKYMEQVLKDLKQVQQLKQCNEVIQNSIQNWKETLWSKVDIEVMVLECKKYAKELYQSDKEVRSWNAFAELDIILKRMLMSLRSISELQNPALRDRHWLQLMQATGVKIAISESTTLNDLFNLNLHNYEEDVKNIVDVAIKELSMEKMLKELNLIWSQTNFEYELMPDRNKLKILKLPETVIETIEDNQVQLQNLLTSKLIGYFAQEIMQWQKKLSTADQVLQLWFEVQRKWLYLEAIFVDSEDIRKQLKDNVKIFDIINKEFKELLVDMETKGNIIKATNTEGLYSKLEHIINQLNICEKTLNEYLEVKRLAYPRFYFISSADLLDILSKGQEPEIVAKHLSKLYDNLAKLIFIKEGSKVTKKAKAMKSKDLDETVQFLNVCDCSGYVEQWLNNVTESMKKTLRHLFQEAVVSYENKSREIWINDYPAQVALCATQIWWTIEVNQAFFEIEQGYENALKEYQKKQINQLNVLISLLLGDLSAEDRQKIMTICTIDVHSRDVVAKMIQSKVDSVNSFQWQSQLKHRWDTKKNDCFANICDAQFCYQYEYLGNTPRLVITPLTDRCYITLTQSLHLVMGGAPAGPAGTGKTETTKDLGRALGVMVYVFNCSEQMDYRSIGNIYKGLSQTGAWGCFDEFNRISVEVLSVVAVQVKCIQDAIKAKKSNFQFVGQEIKLVPTVGIFITMNPGYAGRAELPENLKALFRPCAMVIPDFELICEIMLIAEGFHNAKLLARKFITLYRLCKELLSKQDHYDWGLRAIKSVLVVAGFLKRSDRQRAEDQVLMRALRDFNLPKIVIDDVPVFMGLINDLFPSLSVPRKVDTNFEKIIKEAALKLDLQTEENFILKVTQLEELLAVRHSVFIVGNAGTGKSMVWKTLFKAYQLKDLKPIYNDLNPKAVTNDELFGIINPQTREWKDGLFSIIMREQANLSNSFGPKWIVLDGDIDPMWIESLNTVMDDNKVLTLASNERIALTAQMRLLFEISNLRTATPATVSRAGILYINAQDLGWNPYVTSWLEARKSSNERTNLQILFEKYIPPCLEAVRVKFKKIVALPEISHIQMLCYLLDCLLVESNIPSDCPKEWYEVYFVFAAIWAFGSALYQDQIVDWRNEFSKWWLNEFKTVKFPTSGTIFHYFVDPITKKFTPWKDIVEPFVLDPNIPLQNTLVDIVETTRLKYFLDLLMRKGYPFMIVGGAGTGKTALINARLKQLPESYLVSKMSFNYYTTSEMLQKALEKNLERKVGKNFGPPANRKLVHFIDDMNMPQVDCYGTVQPHTLLRQYMDYKHWYDRSKLCIKEIHNLQFVSAMNPTAGSFTIDSRLLRHFCVFSCNFPSCDSLVYMYTSILSQHVAFSLNRFNQQILKVVEPLVNTAIILHQKISKTFLPTAIKFHYLFNLKDLTNIFQGLLFSNGEVIKTSMELVRLWYHESTRVYGDKLMDKGDNELLNKLITNTTKEHIENIDSNVFKQPLIFCHFAEGVGDEKYAPVYEFSHLKKILDESLKSYNDLVGTLDLVLFEDAINHICRITRILSSPNGNGLMVGVGGSGKQSLTRLAAFLLNLEVFQIQITKGYSMSDLKADLAKLYIQVGVKNVSTVFLITDSQITDEKFLVLINDMLSTGDIADLFNDEEIESIINKSKNEIKSLGLVDTNENCWNYFIGKIRKQLKIIMCFSPIGNILRERSRKFPAIVNCTTINWFYEWPEEALRSVSKRFLQEIPELPENLVMSVSHFMSFVHTSVNKVSEKYLTNEKRYNYTTPKSFLEQIFLFSKLLKSKQTEIDDRIKRLENGLDKLAFTSSEVDELKKVLAVQEVELTAKKEAADKIIKIVCEENEKVANEQAIASEEEAKVRIIEEDVRVKAKVCAEDLAKAEPALIAAQEALKTLNKTNLTELKSFPTPPPAVASVTAAVMVLLAKNGVLPKDRSWKACKVMMGKVDQFLNDLINYNKENIHPEVVKEVKKYTSDVNFRPELILSKSAAAAGLCAWVINTLNFFEIFIYVEPKRQALSAANSELLSAQATLNKLKTKLNSLEMQLDKLKKEFELATADKLKCQAEADATASAIDLANRLVNGLSSENVRWRDAVANLEKSAKTLPGDILLITAFISYMGCFTRQFRLDLFQNYWLDCLKNTKPQIPYDQSVDILFLLNDDAKIAQWNNESLPTDRISSENATILTNCSRWPLMIDPQFQGIKWIKKKYQNELIVTRASSKNYLNTIEKAIESGNVVLLENVEESIDPVLDPILGRNLIKKGTKLKISDKEINYNANFKLILHTKLANPHYKPELQAQTTLINFTVTRDGLEEQLLAEIVKIERPDLEKLRLDLTTQRNDFKITLKFLEDDLLQKLSNASENILQDLDLIENLETTKKTSAEIEKKAAEANITSRMIDQVREQYRPVAKRAVILYFILNNLHSINAMYQFSLKAFYQVFRDAINKAIVSDTLEIRVSNLIDSITYSVFLYTTRSLFETDKLTFLTQMALQILLDTKEIASDELNYLLRFDTPPSNQTSPVAFISNSGWSKITAMSQKIEFASLDKAILGSVNRWKKFVESENPEKEKFPEEWKNKNAIEKLCMMRALRPDRMIYALKLFIEEKLGTKYIQARQMNFGKSYEESSCSTPIFFILSPGVDPLKDVEKLGDQLGYSFDKNNFHNISLGQGQEKVAEQAINTAHTKGEWVILQNIHLVLKWLPVLEKQISREDNTEVNENFRLFISAEPGSDPHKTLIPQGILENSIKITNEPPSGMKANLHKALDNFNHETLESSTKEAEFKAIIFALCYFHAAIAGRGKFGAQGWNRSYPFNFGDLTISVSVLHNYLESNSKVPWEDIRYLFGEIMYGGHITDDWDRRLCRTYLVDYLKPELVYGQLSFAPSFQIPFTTDYDGYHQYIDENLPQESPYLYGLHPNAEIDFFTTMSENLFKVTYELQPKSIGTSDNVSSSKESLIKQTLDEIVDKLPDQFCISDLVARAEDKSPFVIVALQECERMNILLNELSKSLKELDLGLKGELTYNKNMEDLEEALFMNQVSNVWQSKAYPSTLPLGSWFSDLLQRHKELENWTSNFLMPSTVWLGGFFNPQSFLTAIMQQTARKNELPLDKMCLSFDVTKKMKDDFTSGPREGAYVNGLFLEGARWSIPENCIVEPKLKELYPLMPVIFIKAITQDKLDLKGYYECPVYKTKCRGPTFVWTFNLRTKERQTKWIIAGVAILFSP